MGADDDGRLEDIEGYYLSSQAEIRINEKQCFSEQVATLIHESLHAIFYTYGMREIIDDEEKEEYIVNTISNGLMQVIKDNPKLIELIKNAKK